MSDLRRSVWRQLDVDDLIVMKMLSEGKPGKEISTTLGLTPPAISHRFKKYSILFDEEPFFDRKGSRRIPTKFGLKICAIGKRVLDVLQKE